MTESPDHRDHLQRVAAGVAAHPEGLGLVEHAPLEAAAVLTGVAPTVVETVRAALADPRTRERVAALLATAARRGEPGAAPARARVPRDAEALVVAALFREGGLAVLLGASEEAAAITWGVHPDLVAKAREFAARCGLVPAPVGDA